MGGLVGVIVPVNWLRTHPEADIAEGFVRAVEAEIRGDIAGIGDAIRAQRRIGFADADHAEPAAEIGIGAVDLRGVAGLHHILAVEPDQHADGDAVVQGRLTGEIHPDLLAHGDVLAAEAVQAGRGEADRRRRCREGGLGLVSPGCADGVAEEFRDAELQPARRRGIAGCQAGNDQGGRAIESSLHRAPTPCARPTADPQLAHVFGRGDDRGPSG